jgi:hypothetical protein
LHEHLTIVLDAVSFKYDQGRKNDRENAQQSA